MTAPSGRRGLADLAVSLYPAAWRIRYADEVRVYLADSGGGPKAAASLAWRAIPAWIRPARHLHDGPARMRASLATVLAAWAVLAGLAAVFVQLAQNQPEAQAATLASHPVISWAYWVFDGAAAISVVAVVAGGLPLWWRLAGQARAQRRHRDLALLLTPLAAPAAYLVAAAVIVGLTRRPGVRVQPGPHAVIDLANGNIGPHWFGFLVVLGLAVAVLAAAGPGLALRRLQPSGPDVTRAARAAGLAAVTMAVAGAASVVAAAGLYRWASPEAGYHQSWPLSVYVPAVALAAVVALVSGVRGVRAC
jgi:hypothetical protein